MSDKYRVGIVGAGFSGTALLAAIHRKATSPVEIHLFDKSGLFAAGQAYKTPYPYHLLNARARDMSAFEEAPMHFCDWLQKNSQQQVADQFVPRILYHQYLRSILDGICADTKSQVTVKMYANEVVDLQDKDEKIELITDDGQRICVDKAILAIGVEPPGRFPFPMSEKIGCIANPWNYEAVAEIPAYDPVLIVGTGLSMVDTVLTLHHKQHRGPVIAVSRHGMLPLPHTNLQLTQPFKVGKFSTNLRTLFREIRTTSRMFIEAGSDWRAIINMLRQEVPSIWRASSLTDKKRFLRHVLPYWNVHRHRLHDGIFDLLSEMQKSNWLTLYAGRVMNVADENATIKLRHSNKQVNIAAKWIVNCMGFSLHDGVAKQPLLGSLLRQQKAAFDPLRLGFDVTAEGVLKTSTDSKTNVLYALGPPTQGEAWETVGVPEIRKQCMILTNIILNDRSGNNYNETDSNSRKDSTR